MIYCQLARCCIGYKLAIAIDCATNLLQQLWAGHCKNLPDATVQNSTHVTSNSQPQTKSPIVLHSPASACEVGCLADQWWYIVMSVIDASKRAVLAWKLKAHALTVQSRPRHGYQSKTGSSPCFSYAYRHTSQVIHTETFTSFLGRLALSCFRPNAPTINVNLPSHSLTGKVEGPFYI